jgi:hypothetical protein
MNSFETSINTPLGLDISSFNNGPTVLTLTTIPDIPVNMATSFEAFQNFHQWTMSRSAEDRKLYADALRALVYDLEASLPDEEPTDETPPDAADTPRTSSSPTSAAISAAPTASPSFHSARIEMPRVRPHRASPRSHAVPESSEQASTSSSVPYVAKLTVSPVHSSNGIFSTGAVVRHPRQLLPDVLYTGRTPPYWRWSDSDILASVETSLTPHERRLARQDLQDTSAGPGTSRDQTEVLEPVPDNPALAQVSAALMQSYGSHQPHADVEDAVPEGRRSADGHATQVQSNDEHPLNMSKRTILKRMGEALMRKLKVSNKGT